MAHDSEIKGYSPLIKPSTTGIMEACDACMQVIKEKEEEAYRPDCYTIKLDVVNGKKVVHHRIELRLCPLHYNEWIDQLMKMGTNKAKRRREEK